MRRALALLFLLALVPAGAATTIGSEAVTLEVGTPTEVTVERHYESITTNRISYLVSGRYDPRGIVARDGVGELDCELNDLAIGQELLCTPRKLTDYNITITYTGDFTSAEDQELLFSFINRIFVPTEQVTVRTVLPEGYGLSDRETPYQPADARVSSEGRRIFLEWDQDNVSIGDTIDYRVRYEELAVLEKIAFQQLAVILAVVVLLLAAAIALVYRRHTERKTIASIFPVLKDDEKEVLRYIIDEGGEVEQREIVQDSDYSKAKISKLVSDLEERNLIEKEKRGRINVVTLTREVGDLNGS